MNDGIEAVLQSSIFQWISYLTAKLYNIEEQNHSQNKETNTLLSVVNSESYPPERASIRSVMASNEDAPDADISLMLSPCDDTEGLNLSEGRDGLLDSEGLNQLTPLDPKSEGVGDPSDSEASNEDADVGGLMLLSFADTEGLTLPPCVGLSESGGGLTLPPCAAPPDSAGGLLMRRVTVTVDDFSEESLDVVDVLPDSLPYEEQPVKKIHRYN